MDAASEGHKESNEKSSVPNSGGGATDHFSQNACIFDKYAAYRTRPKRIQISVSLCPRVARALTSAHLNVSKYLASKLKTALHELNLKPLPGDDEVWGWRDVGDERQLISFKTAAAWGLWAGGPVPEDCEPQNAKQLTVEEKAGMIKRVVL